MTDPAVSPEPRPRPQYGEYATPEEQRARIAGPVAAELEGQPAVAAAEPEPTPAPASPAAEEGDAPAPRRRPVDRIVTYLLLGYGLVTVITSIPALTDYSGYASTMFEVLGVDAQLADPAAGRPWGLAAALVLGLGWLATAVLSLRSLRRGRLTWWIPLVAGVAVNLVSSVIVLVPLFSDPGFQDALLQLSTG